MEKNCMTTLLPVYVFVQNIMATYTQDIVMDIEVSVGHLLNPKLVKKQIPTQN